MLSKIGRLFRIETRFEAWLVIYVIALGAVERGQHYLAQYSGFGGWLLAAACTGVVFIAGARLLDSVSERPELATGSYAAPARRNFSDSRPRARRSQPGSESRSWLRTGSRPTRPQAARSAASPEDRTHSPDY